VAAQLRNAIEEGDYPPGARLVERTLAASLGVSHIPVREALTRLEEEGLVVRLPRRGARVAQLSAAQLAEVSSLRMLLEGFVVRRVLERWNAEAAAELGGTVEEMVAAAERGDGRCVSELDGRFHATLWRLADHALLVEVASHMRGRINRFLRDATASLTAAELVDHAATHRRLVQVIGEGDAAAAEAAMHAHIAAAAERIGRGVDGAAPRVSP
jgi:DNA-binding GntR family transcriptional regulator